MITKIRNIGLSSKLLDFIIANGSESVFYKPEFDLNPVWNPNALGHIHWISINDAMKNVILSLPDLQFYFLIEPDPTKGFGLIKLVFEWGGLYLNKYYACMSFLHQSGPLSSLIRESKLVQILED